MIGNTIETDLVGEIVEVWQRDERPRLVARGRVRAATGANGGVYVWLELLDHGDVAAADDYLGRPVHRVGDIICMGLSSASDYSTYSIYLRLIKQL